MTTQHTVESLTTIIEAANHAAMGYAQEDGSPQTARRFREEQAKVKAALTEVMRELENWRSNHQELAHLYQGSIIERDTLQSKCDEQAREIERLTTLAKGQHVELYNARLKIAAMESAFHYPDCWDTAAYPTLADAIHEMQAWFKCGDELNPCSLAPGAAPKGSDSGYTSPGPIFDPKPAAPKENT